jgi:hypothetical protein
MGVFVLLVFCCVFFASEFSLTITTVSENYGSWQLLKVKSLIKNLTSQFGNFDSVL